MLPNFPGGPVDKNSFANAGGTGLIPGLGRFHMPWGNHAPVPQLLKPMLPEPVLGNYSVAPLPATRESPCVSVKTQCNQINK